MLAGTCVLLPSSSAAMAASSGTSLAVSRHSTLLGSAANAAAMPLSCCWSARAPICVRRATRTHELLKCELVAAILSHGL